MVKIALNIPIIIIKVNEINSPMKRQRLSDIFLKNPGHTDKATQKDCNKCRESYVMQILTKIYTNFIRQNKT